MASASAHVGIGFDVHRFCTGRPLLLGGVKVNYPQGLAGHSDADVLLHAISDAILGAAGLGDIGQHFPDTDQKWKDADSGLLLKVVVAKAHAAGWQVGNIDATVICEEPKIAPLREAVCARVAELAGIVPAAVNIKGKTTEHLGFLGRCEGIAAQAVVLLERLP
ncbi:MAG TPA: 2-C-methyl-D-erythritol 2,4-cyclodiphosphate synthase [bacterium]|nr:2-C-methyl-D-erythritol 2,4-cyclodiphosphate synthase [bacterium]